MSCCNKTKTLCCTPKNLTCARYPQYCTEEATATTCTCEKYQQTISGVGGTVLESTHKKGLYPIVQILDAGKIIDAEISIDVATGNVTWATNVSITGHIFIL